MVWSEVWSVFGELGSTTIQGIPRQGVHLVVGIEEVSVLLINLQELSIYYCHGGK